MSCARVQNGLSCVERTSQQGLRRGRPECLVLSSIALVFSLFISYNRDSLMQGCRALLLDKDKNPKVVELNSVHKM